MRLVFFGTPEFAVPTLVRLAGGHEIAAVVSQPDRPSGRGRRVTPSPVSVAAQERGLALLRPERGRRAGGGSRRCARARRTSASWWHSVSSCRRQSASCRGSATS
jgi:methionyl-tRNA formyltransferase